MTFKEIKKYGKRLISGSMLGMLLLISCSNNKDDNSYQIVIREEMQNLSFEGVETQGTVEFTTNASWKATVTESNASGTTACDWLTLKPSEGVGGNASISLSLKANNTETSRTAIITIACGDAAGNEITVTQGARQFKTMLESDVQDFDKYFKPSDFKNMDMLRSDSKWSWFRARQSEHFVVFWEPGFGEDPNASDVDAALRVDIDDLLQKAEQFFTTNVNVLKFATMGNNSSYLDRYKMQIYLLYQTEWLATGAGYDNTIGALWVNPGTCQPVGSTIAHEIGHSFQYQVYCDYLLSGATNDFKKGFRYGYEGSNGGNGFWEQCAQWQSFQNYPEQLFPNYHFSVWMDNYHRHFEHEWMRYASYWLQYYWAQKHGVQTIGNIWKESAYPEDAIMAYTRMYCDNQTETMYNELYDYAARMATFDIDGIRDYADGYIGKYSTKLYSLSDGYYQVGYASCPGNTGFNVIALNVPDAHTSIVAEFAGLSQGASLASNDPGEYKESDAVAGNVRKYNVTNAVNAGWRYGFVALKNNGSREYGTMSDAASGTLTFEVPSNTRQLYFVVMGSPAEYFSHPWDEKELNDAQYPYKVKFKNTDILGSITIDPDATPSNLTMTYDLSFAAAASSYDGTVVNLNSNGDISLLANALAMQPNAISSALLSAKSTPKEGKIAFAAVTSDGSLNYNTTANGYGFWYDSKGDVTNWGSDNDSKTFIEFDGNNFEFTIGQYPGKSMANDKYTIKTALVYTKESVQYQITFVFNITLI